MTNLAVIAGRLVNTENLLFVDVTPNINNSFDISLVMVGNVIKKVGEVDDQGSAMAYMEVLHNEIKGKQK
ncbi:hypothetical protein [Psychrobacter arcticus]|uniref:hypothetical protein n=1 Tax=Psychrobacter arcticus TaxID=334543 RepID=UPI000045E3BA|nr:hypothetical protein [Psychrobacter arcticus]